MREHIKERGLELAKGAQLYGQALEEMTRDELLAAAALGWNQYRELLQERERDRRFDILAR